MIRRFCLLSVVTFYGIMLYEIVKQSKELFQSTDITGISQGLQALRRLK